VHLLGSAGIRSPSRKRIAQNYRKIYCCDWAMATSVTGWSEKRTSRNLEAMVYWHLARRGFDVSYDLAGPDKAEIDFIVAQPGEPPFAAVQVCSDLTADVTVAREMKGLSWYASTNPRIRPCVIAPDGPTGAAAVPNILAVDFLLGIDSVFPGRLIAP
jgi:predicted AAA+ superfamily ATPase